MAAKSYQTAPVNTPDMPKGIPYIIGNEAAERFSYYGMRTILVVFMIQYLMGADGKLAPMEELEANTRYHDFMTAVYFFPLIGALVSDLWLGKYRTILSLSIVYCLGHLALALDETRLGLSVGLTLIAIGAGGIKPCVSAHVGDQFGKGNHHLMTKVYGWFYFSINFGSFISTLLTPVLLKKYGPSVAFGVPGLLMMVATFFFWLGRNQFVHIPARPKELLGELRRPSTYKRLIELFGIYFFVAFFWSLYDQTGSSWVQQALKMDLHWDWCKHTWDAAQVQALNPILILLYIPLFNYVIYPAIDRVYKLTALRKIGLGLFLTAPSFLVIAWIEARLEAGQSPDIVWQMVAYLILTAAEVMVSITCLEFSYTQAPKTIKSVVMSLFLFSVSLGNLITAQVNRLMQIDWVGKRLEGPNEFLFYVVLMLLASCGYVLYARTYQERTVLQDSEGSEEKLSDPAG